LINKKAPQISIVIPTRDRPEFVKYCLHFLQEQTFKEFEVILCDNYLERSCKREWENVQNDSRFKYVTPDKPLAMCDNWEFAISKATGTYVSVISEKYMLRRDALSILFDVLQTHPAELVSWWHETYTVNSLSNDDIQGKYVPILKPKPPEYFDPIKVLEKRLSFEHAPYSRTLGPTEVLGKIYSGCFHKDLLSRIKSTYGRVFPPTSPDITSMVAGLSLATSCIDIGQPLILTCSSASLSTGMQCYLDTSYVKYYFSQLDIEVDKSFANSLPIKSLWVGFSNYIARDYLYIQSLTSNKAFKSLELDRANLLIKIRKNLASISKWQDKFEEQQQLDIWHASVKELDEAQREYVEAQININQPVLPSNQEIHFSGGKDIGVVQDYLPPIKRAEINWIEHKVFRIKDEFLFYDSLKDAMDYFSKYYQHSMSILG
jgi:hypothetical protein